HTRGKPVIHLIHGSEEFLRSLRLREIKTNLGPAEMVELNTTELDGDHLTVAELQRAADVVPFLSERRLVIIQGFLKRLKGNHRTKGKIVQAELASLLDYLEHVPDTTELIFVENEKVGPRHPVFKRLSALAEDGHATIHLCDAPGPRELPGWIQKQAKAKGVTISQRAAAASADGIGSELRLIDTELEKLIAYASPKKRIDTRDVEAIVPYARVGTVFNLTDAIANRQARRAFTLLRQLRDSGASVPYLLTMINRQFRILLQVGEASRAHMTPREIASKFRLQEFVVRRATQQARRWSTEELIHVFELLLRTDVAIKTGRVDPDAALDLLVIELTRRGEPRPGIPASRRRAVAG
ncbi:MAG: DNA polymerase III subunit delta, partial [Anaerolineae bacterium]|nr:DNA polymerase III subunit delta [Anaerolineae bacterium]